MCKDLSQIQRELKRNESLLSADIRISLSYELYDARRLSVSAFIGRPSRARVSFSRDISIPGTDRKKKERAEFIYKHYPRENDKVESFRRPKAVKRLLPARPRSYFNYADLYAASSFHSNKEML